MPRHSGRAIVARPIRPAVTARTTTSCPGGLPLLRAKAGGPGVPQGPAPPLCPGVQSSRAARLDVKLKPQSRFCFNLSRQGLAVSKLQAALDSFAVFYVLAVYCLYLPLTQLQQVRAELLNDLRLKSLYFGF
jgi:hypothetical protein